MRQAPIRAFFASLVLLLLLGTTAEAQLSCSPSPCYTRPALDPPTASDLLIYDGQEKTVVVQIVNLTPYNIVLKDTSPNVPPLPPTPPPPSTSSSVTLSDETEMMDRYRTNRKSFMFAPVGIPRFIPKAPDQAFEPQYLPSPPYPDKTPNPNYIPGWKNTVTRPYTMVFSWDDHNGISQDNWVKWTVKDVKYCTQLEQDPTTYEWKCKAGSPLAGGDVDLGLWMYRIPQTPSKVESRLFPPFVKAALNEILALVGLILDPANPLDWVHMFQATKELAESDFTTQNTEVNAGDKLYLASYVVPNNWSVCSSLPSSQSCVPTPFVPTTSDPNPTGDAVPSFWYAEQAGACPTWGKGVVNVSGTYVTWVSGNPFTSDWNGRRMVINGTAYTINSVTNSTSSTLTTSAGTITGANFTVQGCKFLNEQPHDAPEAGLVVTAHLLRGQRAPMCPPSYSSTTNYSCRMGTLPVFSITVMRPEEFVVPVAGSSEILGSSDTTLTPQLRDIRLFLLQAGAGRIRAMLDQQPDRRTGLVALRSVIQGLNLTQRQVLRQMVSDMLMGKRPTDKERELVRLIATQLQAQLK